MAETTDPDEGSLVSSSCDSGVQEDKNNNNYEENSVVTTVTETKADTLLLALLHYCSSRIHDISTLAGRPINLHEFVVIIISTGIIAEKEFDFDIVADIDDYYNDILKTVTDIFSSNISNMCNRWIHHIACLKMLESCLTHFIHDYHHLECKYEAGVKIKRSLKNYVCCTQLKSYKCTTILDALDKLFKKSVLEITKQRLSFKQFKFYNALCITYVIENLRSSKSDYINSTKHEMKQADHDKCQKNIRIPNNLLEEILELITPVCKNASVPENERKEILETKKTKSKTVLKTKINSKIKPKISSSLRRKIIRKERRKSEKLEMLMKKTAPEQKQKDVLKNHDVNKAESETQSKSETKERNISDTEKEHVSSENKDTTETSEEIGLSSVQQLYVASNTIHESEIEESFNNEVKRTVDKNQDVTIVGSDTNNNLDNKKETNEASNEVENVELLVNKVKQKVIFNILINKLSECANTEREPKNHIPRRK